MDNQIAARSQGQPQTKQTEVQQFEQVAARLQGQLQTKQILRFLPHANTGFATGTVLPKLP